MTETVTLRPTPAGTLRFALVYGSLVAIPAALGWALSGGPLGLSLAIAAAAYAVIALLLWGLAATGRHYVRVDAEGVTIRGLLGSKSVAWIEVASVEVEGPGRSQVWIKRRATGTQRPDPIVLAPFLFGLDAETLRGLLQPPASVG